MFGPSCSALFFTQSNSALKINEQPELEFSVIEQFDRHCLTRLILEVNGDASGSYDLTKITHWLRSYLHIFSCDRE